MKIANYIHLLCFASILIIGCNSKTDVNSEEDQLQDNIVSKFLSDVKSIESDTNTNPIVAFKDLAEEIAEDKIVVSKKNIKKVLIKSKEYSNCVIVTGNHTIVKIISFDNCQQSGSWEACMPKVEGYIKKGKLNYKKDFMNNVIGKPDKQERVAYFFKNETMKEKKSDSYEQAPPLTYHENGNVKVSGNGYKKFYRYFVSAKDGIDLMKSADLKSKIIREIPFGYEVYFKSKSGKILTLVDTIKETGNIRSVDGEWVKIEVELELRPGEEGYFFDYVEDIASTKLFEGYVISEFLEKKLDSTKKNGVWTYFYESGTVEKEVFYLYDQSIKEISYDTDGDIKEIREENNYEYVINTFHKNGNISSCSYGGEFDASTIEFDENGRNLDGKTAINKLSKDIKNFTFYDDELINQKLKNTNISDYKEEENNKMVTSEL